MSDHDHSSSGYSAFDNEHRSPHEDWARPDALSRWDSPYTPGTVSGEHYKWYEIKSSDMSHLKQIARGPASLKAFVIAVTAMLGFGIAGAVLISLIF